MRAPKFSKEFSFWKVTSHRPFVLPVRATCMWGSLWSTGARLCLGKTEEHGEKIVHLPLCPPKKPHVLNWDRTRACTVRGREMTANTMTLSVERKLTGITYEDPVRTAQYTHSVSVIQTSQLMLYREIIAVCSQIHTKHSTQSQHYVQFLNFKPGST